MIRWLRTKLRRRTARFDPDTKRRIREDAERASLELWKQRTPPLPRR